MDDSTITEPAELTRSGRLYPLWAGELALEEHSGSGAAVDAKVCEARLVHRLLPHALRAGCLEEALHPDCAGAATHLAAGQEIRSRPNRFLFSSVQYNKLKGNIKMSIVHLQTASFQQQFVAPYVSAISTRHEDLSGPALPSEEPPASSAQPLGSICRKKQPTAPPPWRDSDRHPKDTLRFNYLDNLDPVE